MEKVNINIYIFYYIGSQLKPPPKKKQIFSTLWGDSRLIVCNIALGDIGAGYFRHFS